MCKVFIDLPFTILAMKQIINVKLAGALPRIWTSGFSKFLMMFIIVDLSLQTKGTATSVNKYFSTKENLWPPMQHSNFSSDFLREVTKKNDTKLFSSLNWITMLHDLEFPLSTWTLNNFRFHFFIGDHNDIGPLILLRQSRYTSLNQSLYGLKGRLLLLQVI